MNNEELIDKATTLIRSVQFENYRFEVREGHGGVFIQGVYDHPDVYTGAIEPQYTRKWLLSPHMTQSEIVQTIFKLCMTSMEHRCREGFLFSGKRIFGPHFNVYDLLEICLDGKENAGGREDH